MGGEQERPRSVEHSFQLPREAEGERVADGPITIVRVEVSGDEHGDVGTVFLKSGDPGDRNAAQFGEVLVDQPWQGKHNVPAGKSFTVSHVGGKKGGTLRWWAEATPHPATLRFASEGPQYRVRIKNNQIDLVPGPPVGRVEVMRMGANDPEPTCRPVLDPVGATPGYWAWLLPLIGAAMETYDPQTGNS